MRYLFTFAAVVAVSINAAAFRPRQLGNPDGKSVQNDNPWSKTTMNYIGFYSYNRHQTASKELIDHARADQSIVSVCGLDAFKGHTAEALLFCSSILKTGTATATVTGGVTTTQTSTKLTTTTIYPSSSRRPTPTPTSTPTPTPTPPPVPQVCCMTPA